MSSGWRYVRNQIAFILFVALLCLGCLALGLMLGYGFFGEGKDVISILSLDKWQTIIEKFTGK